MNVLRILFLLLLPAMLVAQPGPLNGLYRQHYPPQNLTLGFSSKDSFYYSYTDLLQTSGAYGKGIYRIQGRNLTLRFGDNWKARRHLDTPDTLLHPNGDSVHLHLQVVDEVTGEPIPFATLVVNMDQRKAFRSDEHGRAYLSHAVRGEKDTIFFSASGYTGRVIVAGGLAGVYHLLVTMSAAPYGGGHIRSGFVLRFQVVKKSPERLVLRQLHNGRPQGPRMVFIRSYSAREKEKLARKK